MRLLTHDNPLFVCVSCQIPIDGMPVFHVGLPFCCAGCVANGPCTCSYDGPDELRAPQPRMTTATPAMAGFRIRPFVTAGATREAAQSVVDAAQVADLAAAIS
jgi:hypothetical protein